MPIIVTASHYKLEIDKIFVKGHFLFRLTSPSGVVNISKYIGGTPYTANTLGQSSAASLLRHTTKHVPEACNKVTWHQKIANPAGVVHNRPP